MIAPLRRRHRLTIIVLAVAAPVVLIAGLAARPDAAIGSLPALLVVEASGPVLASVTLEPVDADGPTGRVDVHAEHLVVELTSPLRAPSVLAYWLPAAAAIPDDAALALGPVSQGRPNVWPLPEAARGGGYLMLWSLGHGRAVAGADLPVTDSGATP